MYGYFLRFTCVCFRANNVQSGTYPRIQKLRRKSNQPWGFERPTKARYLLTLAEQTLKCCLILTPILPTPDPQSVYIVNIYSPSYTPEGSYATRRRCAYAQ